MTKWIGSLLFLLGVLGGMSLAAALTWSEVEASVASTPADSKPISLSCPWILSANETGTIRATIVNELDEEVKPVVIAGFGQAYTSSQKFTREIYVLAPKETQSLEWQVDASSAAYGRVIPVVVTQSRYSLNPPRWGICGILLYSLFGLNGITTLILILSASILCIVAGYLMFRPSLMAQGDQHKVRSQMVNVLILLTFASLTTSLLRWWGLTILFEVISAISIVTILTELIIPRGRPG